MLRGFDTAAMGMISQQRRTEMLTNNIANANTPGFKADQATLRSFPEMLLERIGQDQIPTEKGLSLPYNKTIGPLNTGVYVQEVAPSFKQGNLRETGNDTDISLVDGNLPNGGSVFFTVRNEDGTTSYTRNGSFTLDGAGFLTTPEGNYVLDDDNEPIQIASGKFQVSPDGRVLENNAEIARLNISFIANAASLTKQGNGLYNATETTQVASAYANNNVTFETKQGFIEGSNVDLSRSMTDMMTAYRAFEANQKILQAYDRSLEKAVNEIGRI